MPLNQIPGCVCVYIYITERIGCALSLETDLEALLKCFDGTVCNSFFFLSFFLFFGGGGGFNLKLCQCTVFFVHQSKLLYVTTLWVYV